MFHKDKCDLCGDCLVECKYTEYVRKSAIEEMTALIHGRPTNIVKECITCAACNEICPQGANPFDLICKTMEKTGSLELPESIVQMYETRVQMSSEVRKGKPGKPAISLCLMEQSLPRPLEGSLFDDLTQYVGGDYYCYIGWIHFGLMDRVDKGVPQFIEALAATGEKEIIFLHDDCYASATTLAREYGIDVPFRPIHIIEYLRDQMKARKGEIKKLDIKIAYQRPCASRYTPEKEPMLDELFDLIGVERVARKYDRENASCCALPMMFRDMDRMGGIQKMNLDDAKGAGAEAMTFLCPVCIGSLGAGTLERGMDIYMLSDLCRLALGEELPALSS